MKTFQSVLKGILLLVMLATLAACGGGGGGGGGGNKSSANGGAGDGDGGGGTGGGGGGGAAGGTTSASIVVDFGQISGALLLPPGQNFAQAPPSDVLHIDIEVLNGVTPLGTFPMTFSGSWSVTINNLPVGVSLTFQASGYNSTTVFNGTTLIYSGTTVQTLANVPESVSISMDPAAITVTFPQITSITIPAQFETDSTGGISFGLASSSSPLDYAITAGGGGFSPASGSIPITGTATLNIDFTAPSTAGTYTHSIDVTNPDAYTVGQQFETVVVDAVTDATVTVLFAPALTALRAERFPINGTDVIWTATAVDDITAAGALVFGWSFANDPGSAASFAASTTNVATLQGYDPAATAGVLTMTITDGDGLTTIVTYTLSLNQFPTY